jgi:hypothetical protein
MNDSALWIAVLGSALFLAVLVWKGLWLLRQMRGSPPDEDSGAGASAADAAEALGGEGHGDEHAEQQDDQRNPL